MRRTADSPPPLARPRNTVLPTRAANGVRSRRADPWHNGLAGWGASATSPFKPMRTANSALPILAFLANFALPWQEAGAFTLPPLVNAGFDDDGTGVAAPLGWTSSGDIDDDFTEFGGHESNYRLSHWSTHAFTVETSQTIRGLRKGWYTLRVRARRSPGDNEATIELDCGQGPAVTAVPVAWADQWLEVVASAYASAGSCTLRLRTDAAGGEWTNFDTVALEPGRAALSVLGADVSSIVKAEALRAAYYTDRCSGASCKRQTPALKILSEHGATHARARVWVDSADGYHERDDVVKLARCAKNSKLELFVDLHYSDTWADPGRQTKPAAWADLSFEALEDAVYDHTYDVCTSIRDAARAPAMIQLGNEINSGMLWPDGHTWDPPNWENLGRLLNAGAAAVRDCSPHTRVVLHLADGGDNGLYRWWFDNIVAQGVDFDVIAASYYGYWHGSLGDLQQNLFDIAERYDRDVMVAETAYPFTLAGEDDHPNLIGLPEQLVEGYPATPEGQAANLRDVLSIVRAVPGGRGLGAFYWEATWTAVPGNGWDPAAPSSGNPWENQALFDFSSRALPAMSEFVP